MKMKRYFRVVAVMYACVCACALASCHNEEEPAEMGAIAFSSEAEDMRAVVAHTDMLEAACSSGEGIGVWCVVNDEHNTNQLLIDNAKLTFKPEADAWEYAPVRHWIRGAKHDFWAIFPYSSDSDDYSFDAASGIVTYNNIVLGTQTTAQNLDLLCAVGSRDLNDPTLLTSTPVPLDMHHNMSLLQFNFINARDELNSGSSAPVLTNISLRGHLYKGSLEFGPDGSINATKDGAMDTKLTVLSDTAPKERFPGYCSKSIIPKNLTTRHNFFENVLAMVVMPQIVAGRDVIFEFDMKGERKSLNLGTLEGVAARWEPGKVHIYTITLTSTTITCDVKVVDWVKDEVELTNSNGD